MRCSHTAHNDHSFTNQHGRKSEPPAAGATENCRAAFLIVFNVTLSTTRRRRKEFHLINRKRLVFMCSIFSGSPLTVRHEICTGSVWGQALKPTRNNVCNSTFGKRF